MKIRGDGYYVNRHSCFLLQYHLVLVTKYRRPAITGEVEKGLKEYTVRYFGERGCVLHEMETMPDHIHLLFDALPQVRLSDFVNAYKSASSRMVRKQYPEQLRAYYWKPYFWSLSYFIGSVSDRTAAAVAAYIRDQKNGK